jgi:hypothetical protein
VFASLLPTCLLAVLTLLMQTLAAICNVLKLLLCMLSCRHTSTRSTSRLQQAAARQAAAAQQQLQLAMHPVLPPLLPSHLSSLATASPQKRRRMMQAQMQQQGRIRRQQRQMQKQQQRWRSCRGRQLIFERQLRALMTRSMSSRQQKRRTRA